jgi:hypothetical protein
VGTSGQPFHRVYLGGSTPGLYVGGTQVVGSQSTGWSLTLTGLANGKDNDISSAQLSSTPSDLDEAATFGNLVSLAETVASMYSALKAHGIVN